MAGKDAVTGWTLGLLALQLVCQGVLALFAAAATLNAYDDHVQTLDMLAATPLSNFMMLACLGFGIFRTPRLSLALTLIMLLPWIDASVALAAKGEWDPQIQGSLRDPAQVDLILVIAKYGAYALIATCLALAYARAAAKSRAELQLRR